MKHNFYVKNFSSLSEIGFHVAHTALERLIRLLPHPLDYRGAPPHPVHEALGVVPRALCLLAMSSALPFRAALKTLLV